MTKTPTGRALQLLSLLQTHRWWRGSDLADRLGVTERTVRRDVDRLRELDYPIDATTGRYGGYRLASGARLPPLVLDDDEAVAVAVGLRYAAEAAISGIEESSLRALTKLERLLPSRLRRRVSALRSSVISLPWAAGTTIDPEAISVLAGACQDREEVRFAYRRADGVTGRRFVQPHQLVTAGRRWYLVAWDRDRDDWRIFRLDRLRAPRLTGGQFTPREVPGGDAAGFVASAIRGSGTSREVTVVIGAPLAELEDLLPFVDHTLLADTESTCVVRLRGEDAARLALTIARVALSAPVEIVPSEEIAAEHGLEGAAGRPGADEVAEAVMRMAAHLTGIGEQRRAADGTLQGETQSAP